MRRVSNRTIVLAALGLWLTAFGWSGLRTSTAQAQANIDAGPRGRPVVIESSLTNGRYQVVNPTPEFLASTMLLDTATGRTWEICGGNQKAISQWCPMVRN